MGGGCGGRLCECVGEAEVEEVEGWEMGTRVLPSSQRK